MSTTITNIEPGFNAAHFNGVVLYYSFGTLIGVQDGPNLFVSVSYWLGETEKHLGMLRYTQAPDIIVETVTLDIVHERMREAMRRVFA